MPPSTMSLSLANDDNHTIALKKMFKFFSSTSTSEELCNASNSCEALIGGFDSQFLMRRSLPACRRCGSKKSEVGSRVPVLSGPNASSLFGQWFVNR
jgi:hypothetical protein